MDVGHHAVAGVAYAQRTKKKRLRTSNRHSGQIVGRFRDLKKEIGAASGPSIGDAYRRSSAQD
jgi:hypothetical protein